MIRLLSLSLVAILMAAPAAADPPSAQIVDQPGDANGVNGQWHDPAVIGQLVWITYQQLFQGDPAGEGKQTPVSYGPADLRESRLETEYVAVPVGEDGIDYRATGVRWTIRTEEMAAPPADQPRDLSLRLIGYWHAPDREVCDTSLSVSIAPGGAVRSDVGWYRFSSCSGGLASGSIPGWSASRGADPREIVVRMPAAALDETLGGYLAEGATFASPRLVSGLLTFTFDVSQVGAEFTVGEDMPADVPCTRGCPAG